MVSDGVFDSAPDTVQVDVVDTLPPEIACNAPETVRPPEALIELVATAVDACGGPVFATVAGYDCYAPTSKGRRVDKTESCVVSFEDDTLRIEDVGGVGTFITWEVTAEDGRGNADTVECEVEIVNPVCGLGYELGLALGPLMWLRRRCGRTRSRSQPSAP